MKTQYREFEGPAIAAEEYRMTKIVAKKIENKFSKILDEDANRLYNSITNDCQTTSHQ